MTAPASQPVELTLRRARGAQQQQAAIDAWLAASLAAPPTAAQTARAVIAEGALFELTVPDDVALARLAPGCVCCLGLVPLRVTLTRLLRARPRALLLLVAADDHLPQLRALIASGDLGPLTLREFAPEAR
jgi:hypothetical protein